MVSVIIGTPTHAHGLKRYIPLGPRLGADRGRRQFPGDTEQVIHPYQRISAFDVLDVFEGKQAHSHALSRGIEESRGGARLHRRRRHRRRSLAGRDQANVRALRLPRHRWAHRPGLDVSRTRLVSAMRLGIAAPLQQRAPHLQSSRRDLPPSRRASDASLFRALVLRAWRDVGLLDRRGAHGRCRPCSSTHEAAAQPDGEPRAMGNGPGSATALLLPAARVRGPGPDPASMQAHEGRCAGSRGTTCSARRVAVRAAGLVPAGIAW
jgi:hypothetical protein